MKSSHVSAASLTLSLLLVSIPVANASSLKDGDACNPAGAIFKPGKTTFVCKKVGMKVVWKAKAPTPSPKDTFKMQPDWSAGKS